MQQLIPAAVLSRVDSYDWLISLVVMPAGYVVAGPLALHTGDAAVLTGAAAVLGVSCGLTVLIPGVRAVRRTPDGTVVGPPPSRPGPPRDTPTGSAPEAGQRH